MRARWKEESGKRKAELESGDSEISNLKSQIPQACLGSRLDGFDVFELAVLDGDDDGLFGGVVLGVDGGVTGDAWEVFGLGQGVADVGPFGVPGPADGVNQNEG